MGNDRKDRNSFFSIGFDLVLTGEELPYDLYINSSSHSVRERFVRIFPAGEKLSKEEVKEFRKKYHQLYILENQRDKYLRSLIKSNAFNDTQKTEVVKGTAIHYLDKIFDEDKEFNTELLDETIKGCKESVENMVEVIKDYNISEVQDLIGTLSFHDFYTYDHSINVSMYSIAIFKSLKPGATKEELTMAGLGGMLHDLGKIKISTRIINNPGKLSEEDFQEIKNHPDYGLELMDEEGASCQCEGVDFDVIKRVVHEHHENFNGTGYPSGLAGREIHILARVTAIADFFDAITTKRSYHEVLSTEDALEVMSRSVGRKIDPKIFDVFTKEVANLIMKGKGNKELDDDFDPCQPHNVLPLKQVDAEIKEKDFLKKEKQDFGKVKSDGFSISKDDSRKDKKKAS